MSLALLSALAVGTASACYGDYDATLATGFKAKQIGKKNGIEFVSLNKNDMVTFNIPSCEHASVEILFEYSRKRVGNVDTLTAEYYTDGVFADQSAVPFPKTGGKSQWTTTAAGTIVPGSATTVSLAMPSNKNVFLRRLIVRPTAEKLCTADDVCYGAVVETGGEATITMYDIPDSQVVLENPDICGPRTIMNKDTQKCEPLATHNGILQRTELQPPPEYRSDHGKLEITLVMDVSPYADAYYYCPKGMRMFNGLNPGPTWYVKPGDEITLHFHNNLEPEPEGTEYISNTFNGPNMTNIHTHGLHISAHDGTDNVKLNIDGGESYEYVYHIPDDHMPGHHWYHPHRHGSTALQAITTFGNIIVEQTEFPGNHSTGASGFADHPLPEPLSSMRKIVAVLGSPTFKANDVGFMNMNFIFTMMGMSDDWHCLPRGNEEDVPAVYRMVNGQSEPIFTMERNEPVQFNFLNVDWMNSANFTVVGCDMHLMAKDGVPLYDAPRKIDRVHLPSGGRGEVVITCDTAGEYEFLASDTGDVPFMTLVVTTYHDDYDCAGEEHPSIVANISALSPLAVNWPAYLPYLANLSNTEVDTRNSIKYEFGLVSWGPDYRDSNGDAVTENFFHVNGKAFDHDQATWTVNFGDIVETTLTQFQAHPHHQHINPGQLTIMPGTAEQLKAQYGDWHKIGDWHDVTQFVGVASNWTDLATFRWFASTYGNETMIFHCHILPHEDQGMMGFFHINGDPNATEHDPHGSGLQVCN